MVKACKERAVALGMENMGIEAAKNNIDLSRVVRPEGAVVDSKLKDKWRFAIGVWT